jgi:hypothetical protein
MTATRWGRVHQRSHPRGSQTGTELFVLRIINKRGRPWTGWWS